MNEPDAGPAAADPFIRTKLLYGSDAIESLANKKVAVFGIGGVGSYVCEALVRCGVGRFILVDSDTIDITNLNRQIHAVRSTLGRYKTEVMKERMLDINPNAEIEIRSVFFLPENSGDFPFGECDYVMDAVDTVTAKLAIIMCCKERNIPVISAMGAGNKLDPTRFRIADIYDTKVCPLAKVMRHELKKRGVTNLKVVYSDEAPLSPSGELYGQLTACEGKRSLPGSSVFCPASAGLAAAAEIIKDLTEI